MHPAWTPRQNLTSSLDTMLSDFQRDSGLSPSAAQRRSRHKAGAKTEGVLVGCTGGSHEDTTMAGTAGREDDEMIWWCWDGRLIGFSEWS